MKDPDTLEQRLAELPRPDVSEETSRRILSKARRSMDVPHRGVWTRVVEPALVAAVVLLYGAWGVSTAGGLVASTHRVAAVFPATPQK